MSAARSGSIFFWPDSSQSFTVCYLLPAVRRRLECWIPAAFYGLFFCITACLGLLLVMMQWRSSSLVVWQMTGSGAIAVEVAFAAGWPALVYSLYLSGLGYQTGWTAWWHWLRRRPEPRRQFRPRSAYRIMRHPVYLCFLGLIWFVPTVTLDRAVLIAIWTGYVFVGSYLKDRRLGYYLGGRYRKYQARVPGYPGMIFGPLARVPWGGNGSPEKRRHHEPLTAVADARVPVELKRQSSVKRAALTRAIGIGLRLRSLSAMPAVTQVSTHRPADVDRQRPIANDVHSALTDRPRHHVTVRFFGGRARRSPSEKSEDTAGCRRLTAISGSPKRARRSPFLRGQLLAGTKPLDPVNRGRCMPSVRGFPNSERPRTSLRVGSDRPNLVASV